MSNRKSFIIDSMPKFWDELADSERETSRANSISRQGDGEGSEDDRKLVLFVTVVSARGLAAPSGSKGGGELARDLASSLLAKASSPSTSLTPSSLSDVKKNEGECWFSVVFQREITHFCHQCCLPRPALMLGFLMGTPSSGRPRPAAVLCPLGMRALFFLFRRTATLRSLSAIEWPLEGMRSWVSAKRCPAVSWSLVFLLMLCYDSFFLREDVSY